MTNACKTHQENHGMTYSYELEKNLFREELEKLFWN